MEGHFHYFTWDQCVAHGFICPGVRILTFLHLRNSLMFHPSQVGLHEIADFKNEHNGSYSKTEPLKLTGAEYKKIPVL